MSFGGRFGHLARSIGEATDQSQPINTKKAYEPKKKEFLQYCDSVFGTETNHRVVTEEKVYGLYVIMHIEKSQRKGNQLMMKLLDLIKKIMMK